MFATTTIDGVRLTASSTGLDDPLRIGGSDVAAPDAPVVVAGIAPVRVTAGDGPPTAPVTLTFDLTDRPDLSERFSASVAPVVQSVSATDPDRTELTPARWDPERRTATAEVSQLTDHQLRVFDNVRGLIPQPQPAADPPDEPCAQNSELRLGVRSTPHPPTR